MANIIEILIKARDEASKEVKGAEDGLGKLAGAAQKLGMTMAAVEIAKTAIELGELGAQAEASEQKLTALAGGAQQAEGYLRAIGEASGGTVDKMTAMGAASKLLSMGLVENQDGAAKMVEMAVRLGDAQQDTSGRISDFAALLANQSIPRLDNYGISSGRVRARIEELQAAHAGLSREAAFTQAVMEEGQQSLDRLGEAGTGAVQSFDRAKTAIADLKTELAKMVGDGLSPAAEGLYQLLTFNKRVDGSLRENTQAALKAGDSWEVYARRQLEAQIAAGRADELGTAVGETLRRQGLSAEETANFWLRYNSTLEAAIALGVGINETWSRTDFEAYQHGIEAASQGYSDMGVSAAKAAEQTGDLNKAVEASKQAVSDLALMIQGPVGNENKNYSEQMADHKEKAAELQAELEKLQRSHGRMVTTQSKSTLSTAEANLATLQLAQAQQKLAETQDPLERAQLDVKVENLTEKLNSASQATTSYVDNSKKMAEVQKDLDEVNAAMAETEAVHKKAMNQIVYDMMMARLATDGLTESELNFAATVAEKMGLVDKETSDAMKGVNASINAFIQTGDAQMAAGLLAGIADAAGTIPREVNIDVKWNVTEPPAGVSIPTPNGGPVKGYAAGGLIARTGMALVGENGPELVVLPAGARVFNNEDTQRLANNPTFGEMGGQMIILAPIILQERDYRAPGGGLDYDRIGKLVANAQRGLQ